MENPDLNQEKEGTDINNVHSGTESTIISGLTPKSTESIESAAEIKQPVPQLEINNYVFKKVFEEWLETRIVQKKDDLVGIYVLKTHSLMTCHLSDLFPSTIETIRKFKISPIKPTTFYGNPLIISTATKKFDYNFAYDLDTVLADFQEFLLKNKATVYPDELSQFIKYIRGLFFTFRKTLLTENEQKKIKKTIKENEKINCHPIQILRLCIMWHFILRKSISDEAVIETGYEFLIYLTDWIFLTFFS